MPAPLPTNPQSAGDAVRAGLSTVEHEGSLFGGLLLACSTEEEQLRDEYLAMMREAARSSDEQALYSLALEEGVLNRLVDTYCRSKHISLRAAQ